MSRHVLASGAAKQVVVSEDSSYQKITQEPRCVSECSIELQNDTASTANSRRVMIDVKFPPLRWGCIRIYLPTQICMDGAL